MLPITAQKTATGYFGIPGSHVERDCTKVHFLHENGKPLCGARLRKGMQFQWCSWGWYHNYVECDTCRRVARKIEAPFRKWWDRRGLNAVGRTIKVRS